MRAGDKREFEPARDPRKNSESAMSFDIALSKWGWELATLSFPVGEPLAPAFRLGGHLPDAVLHGKRSLRSRSRTGRWLSRTRLFE
jgi:hypothetical protein